MSQFLEFVIPDHSADAHILTSLPESAICVCCLAQNKSFVYLTTCKHTRFLNTFIADSQVNTSKETFTNSVICHHCHNMLKKIEDFRQQVEQSILILNKQTPPSGAIKLHNLSIFEKENITISPKVTEDPQKCQDEQNYEYELAVANVKVENDASDVEIEVPLLEPMGQMEACDNSDIVKKEILTSQTSKPCNLSISVMGNVMPVTPEIMKNHQKIEKKQNVDRKVAAADVNMESDTSYLESNMQMSVINRQMVVSAECDIVKEDIKTKRIKREKADDSSLIDEKYMGILEMFLMTQEELQTERESLKVDEKYLRLPFKCDKCIIGFNRELYLKKHCKQRHDKSLGKYICGVCETVCITKQDLDAHYGRHFIRYECKSCSERYIDERSAVTHYTEKHATMVPNKHEENEFQCRISECDFKTLEGAHLRTHMQSAHTSAPYCVACRTYFRTNTILQHHLKHHSKHVTDEDKNTVIGPSLTPAQTKIKKSKTQAERQREYRLRKKKLKEAQNMNKPAKKTRAEYQREYRQRKKLKAKLNYSSAEIIPSQEAGPSWYLPPEATAQLTPSSPDAGPTMMQHEAVIETAELSIANRKEKTQQQLEDISKDVKLKIVQQFPTRDHTFDDICQLPNQSILTPHLRHDEMRHISNQHVENVDVDELMQPQDFYDEQNIMEDKPEGKSRVDYDPERRYICDLCDSRFTMKSYLKSHIEWVHLKKDYQCPQCSKVLSTSRNLRRHIDFVHKKREMPRDKMCHYCGKGFSTRNLLQAHIRTHTGERPFKCEQCSATFAQSGALYTHKRLVHNPLRGDTKRNKGKIK